MDEMEQENITFGYVDLGNKQNLLKHLKSKYSSQEKDFPILKNEKGEYFTGKYLEDKKWKELIEFKNKANDVDELIKNLLVQQKVMVFIKGSPDFPECKYSRKIIDYLNSKNIKYGYFNIFTNEELRQRLKVVS